jgi:uroporphyrinogen decarboxylase
LDSRQRVRKILNHKEADRPAIDLGSTVMTGTSAWNYRALKRALGLPQGTVRVIDLFQMLAEVEEPVLDALGCDFVMLPAQTLFFGLEYGRWEPYTFWDGQTFDVPAGFRPRVTADGALEMSQDPGGPIDMRMPQGGRFFDQIPDPERDYFDVARLPKPEWDLKTTLSDEYLRREERNARELYHATDRALVATPPVTAPVGYGNFYYWAIQMMTEPAYCLDYMMTAAEAARACIRQYLEAVGSYLDVLVISGHDFGTQDREIFRPELFATFFVPAWRLINDMIHEFPHVKVWIHSCGSVPHMIPHFIEAGVDCLNPIQWTAAGMDPRWLKETFGEQLTFWGGAISTQRTFPFGTPAEVAAETREILDIMTPGGGYVVNPIHNVLPEVPIDNILALYDTAKNYRYPKGDGPGT